MRIIKQRFNTTFMAALLLALLITLISCAGAIAHPHVFVSSKVDVEFNKDKLTGARLHWTFDTMFSSMIAEEFDGDKNGLLDEAEIASIREGAFSNLSNFNYFTTVEIDNTPLKILEVTDFKAALSDGTLSYSFFIPMSISAGPGHKTIILNQFDPSYYAMLFFAEKEPVLVKGQEGLEVTCKIHENPEEISSGSLTSPWSL